MPTKFKRKFMKTEKPSTTPNDMQGDLKIVKMLVFDQCGFAFTNFKKNIESAEYEACTFYLNEKSILYRVSKITPTKNGQFVAIWKRNNEGTTEPFDISDDFDFMIISSKSGNNFGQFIFPKSVLADNGIITKNGKEGKRGMRVYPPWDIAANKQAIKTQNWQTKHFFSIKNDEAATLDLIKKLFPPK